MNDYARINQVGGLMREIRRHASATPEASRDRAERAMAAIRRNADTPADVAYSCGGGACWHPTREDALAHREDRRIAACAAAGVDPYSIELRRLVPLF